MMMEPWQKLAEETKASIKAALPKEWLLPAPRPQDVEDVMSIPYECGILSDQELFLTDQDATTLAGMLAEGKLKSYDLTLAFCKRAAIAHQLVSLPCPTALSLNPCCSTQEKFNKRPTTDGRLSF